MDNFLESLGSRFHQQVENRPEAIALIAGQERISYRELERRANQIAHVLLNGLGSDSRLVATVLPQGIPLIAAMIGCFKAGKCFAPLDPKAPPSRLEEQLELANCSSLIADSGFDATTLVNGLPEATVFDVQSMLTGTSDTKPDVTVQGSQPAYVFFTSGSAGKPKGVMHSHLSLLNNVHVHTEAFQIKPEDRQTLLYSPSVYGAARDTLNALLNGATLCLYDIQARGLTGLADWIDEQEVSLYCSVATVFRKFMATVEEGRCFPSVRLVKLGGERVPWTDADFFRAHFLHGCQLSCGLAMSEATAVTQFFVDTESVRHGAFIPLGEPVEGKELLLLNDSGQPVRDGDVGEVVVRSQHLAMGYVNQPDLTKDRFLPDSAGTTARLYRTGDLARRLQDGQLEFQGRSDAQTKILGFRVDVTEIENKLRQVRNVQDAIVVAEENDHGNRLIAYVVPCGPDALVSHELRRALSEILPPYMIPSLFATVDNILQTPSGKPDRKAMFELYPPKVFKKDDMLHRDAAGVGSKGMERDLANIWCSTLKMPSVSYDDDFFEMGGESLKAVELVTLIESQLGVTLPISSIMTAPTFSQLLRLIQQPSDDQWSPLVTLQPEGDRPPLFLVHPVRCNLLHYSDLVRYLKPSGQPVYGLQARGLNGKEAPATSIIEMAKDYCHTIRQHQSVGPYFLGGSSFGGKVAYEMARQFRASGEEVALLAIIDTYAFGFGPIGMYSSAWKKFFYGWGTRIRNHWANFWSRKIPDRVAYVRDTVQNARNKWRGVSKRVPERIKRVRRANWEASKVYKPDIYSEKLTLFRAQLQPLGANNAQDLGWGVLAENIEIHHIEGYHGECCLDPYVPSLATHLNACIQRSLDDWGETSGKVSQTAQAPPQAVCTNF